MKNILFVTLLATALTAPGWAQQTKKAAAPTGAKSVASMVQSAAQPRILVFSRTAGYRHQSIPAGQKALIQMGIDNGFAVDTTENAAKFTEANLKRYGAVVFLSTTGNVLDDNQQAAFERYIQSGGGYVGIHAATDTEYDWPWYGKLAGAYFLDHPGIKNKETPNVQPGEAFAVNKEHPATVGFPERWKIRDEFYSFKNVNPDLNILVKIDEKTYKDGLMGDNHPMAWYHNFDGGKAFYTNFGHADETFADAVFKKHLLGGLQSVMATKLDYSKATSQIAPEENRFEKKVLVQGLDEPTELAILSDGKVLFGQRKGELKLYNPKTKVVKVVANFPVYTKFEYGLMGLNVDPNFKQNKFIYAFYSPITPGDTAQHLSRFVYDDVRDTLLLSTEKVLLRVPVKRTECCHTGGSIAWDKKGNLYLSTGDDTNPFASQGYAPIDERPNRGGWDARLTSSNTNDLRGKILRITPQPDGTYTIPDGNLFPKGTDKARAEIYVMGNRNPYRISVDQRTGFLYWGEVGPDAGENNEKFGPRGHDEMNQARQAGYFGWPLFVADNRPYNTRSFTDSTTGARFDPARPINDSPHNTGLQQLPPAQKAFIYYPYAESPEFGAIVGKGGRNAMGGPVYYYDDYAESNVKFPRYYDGKFFAYDWMRDWISPVTMTPTGDFVKMERIMPNTKFSHTIDMQFAGDGSLYTLEYGQNWFAQNTDAALSQITYNAGNRRPVAIASANKLVGAAPLAVAFNAKGTMDYDGDALKYEWNFGKGFPKSTQPNPSFTYTKAGVYHPVLTVTDASGNVSTQTLDVKVGNDMPKVAVAVKGNKTFYFPNKPVEYTVSVADKEDGTLAKGVATDDVMMTINYLEGFDKTMLAQGHQANTGFSTGKRLIELSDCKSCHNIDKKSIGPAYIDVAKKYKGKFMIEGKLSDKIIKGGGGVWGEQAMSAHPQVTKDDAVSMVRYILSLADDKAANRQPLQGTYVTAPKAKDGSYVFSASYTDKGNGAIGPITNSATVALRSSKLKASDYDGQKEIQKYKVDGIGELAIGLKSGSNFYFNDIDLTDIQSLNVSALADATQTVGGKLEVRADSPTGPLLGESDVKNGTTSPVTVPIKTTGSASGGLHKVYFVFVNPEAKGKPLFAVNWIQFMNQDVAGTPGSSTGQGK
ncbi:MAG: ThuA domain-containing protein [Bacteroidetes bacterium]|nr:ThuA domain-containing protein [Fibrella sp.]